MINSRDAMRVSSDNTFHLSGDWFIQLCVDVIILDGCFLGKDGSKIISHYYKRLGSVTFILTPEHLIVTWWRSTRD